MFYLNKIKENLLKYKYGKYFIVGGFTFFFVKGLVWLGIFILVGFGVLNY